MNSTERFMATQLRSIYTECVRDEGTHARGILNDRYVLACTKLRQSINGAVAEEIIDSLNPKI